ncbi:response regulator transcription factor [Carboxylicivirga taeanensis]|uniref:response regulator transcription factor n=1 Tax=Carboxylicivirga taeanensis TaxID=1416875 RepID=UPI003F6E0DA2
MATNISIIYKHLLWADSLLALIRSESALHISHKIHFSKLSGLNRKHIDLIILEATYPNAELVNQVIQLKESGFPVIVIGYHLDNEFIELLLVKGLDGFVLKTCGQANLFEAIHNVSQGNKYFCAPIAESLSKRLYNNTDERRLTTREKEVLLGLVCLKTTSCIARQLNISEATVRTHRKNIMSKFGSKNYIGLLRYACREGLLQTPDEQFCVGCSNRKCISTN